MGAPRLVKVNNHRKYPLQFHGAETVETFNQIPHEQNGTGGSVKRSADDYLAALPSEGDWIPIPLLEIAVTPLTAADAADRLTNADGKQLLLNHNLHSAYLHQADARFQRLYRSADWVVIDGTPIRWLASWSAGRNLRPQYRIGSTDWIAALPPTGGSKKLFVFGAAPDSNSRAVEKLAAMLPNWIVSGVHGYVDPKDAIGCMNDFQPDIVLVGLGMPTQEYFLLDNASQLPDAVYATVGGAIDYIAGTTRLSPRWIGQLGLEWAWRLAHQPRRLAHRYLLEPLLLIGGIVRKRFHSVRRGKGAGSM